MSDTSNMEMREMLQLFLIYCEKERRYSDHTLQAYRRDIGSFIDYIQKNYGLDKLSVTQKNHMRSYIVFLNAEKSLKAKSIQRKISSLNSFFRYAMKTGYMQKNPLENIQLPKTEKRLPNFLTPDQIEELLEEKHFQDNYESQLERVILSLFILTGIRRGELIALKVHDMDISNMQLKVLGKGNKQRLIPLSLGFIEYLQEFLLLKEKSIDQIQEKHYLLHAPSGIPIYSSLVNKIVKKNLQRTTTLHKKSPHVLRHTFATLISNEGARLQVVQELLGHASLSSTQIYTHSSLEQIRKQYLKAHPRGESRDK